MPPPLHDDALVWFRRDLRLYDHAALSAALQSARRVHCVFVFDRDILDTLRARRDRRVEFIHASVAALKTALQAYGSDLHVLHGHARAEIPALATRLGVAEVHAGRDYEPFARTRDTAVAKALARDCRRLVLHKDHVIFEAKDILTREGAPYRVFTPYKRAWLACLGAQDVAPHATEPWLNRLAPHPATPLPALSELGFENADLTALGITPGEAGARARWHDFQGRIARYHEARDYPARKGPSYLSVHLRFGTISIRELVRFAVEHGGEGAQTWLSELIWREFYQMLLWHYPETAEHAFQRRFDAIAWPGAQAHFTAWKEARTGFPLIDAAMRQLDSSGYMHNRLRMLTASFLVKDLHIDWRCGERHFAAKLIDYDAAANLGGWQWSASVGTDAQPWFRIFNPITQSQRFDPDGAFIRRYLPELARVPDRFLHAPWRMPPAEQSRCGVHIGRDYPPPIVDHAAARATTLALFRAAGAANPTS